MTAVVLFRKLAIWARGSFTNPPIYSGILVELFVQEKKISISSRSQMIALKQRCTIVASPTGRKRGKAYGSSLGAAFEKH